MSIETTPSQPGETRAVARLPGLDIAVIHTAAQGGRGESVAVMLQKTALQPLPVFDPIRLWAEMAQAAWAPWIALNAALWGLPKFLDRK